MDAGGAEGGRFEAVVLPHLDAAYSFARYLVHDPYDAEDIVQDAVLRALRHFGRFDGGDARAWLLAIVRNTCFTHLRKHRVSAKVVEFDEDLHSGAAGAEDLEMRLLQEISRERIMEAMRLLPDEFREVLILREVQDFSYKEIGVITGVPVGTVMSRLSRARQRMQRILCAASRPQPERGS